MKDKYDTLTEIQTWDLVPRLPNANIIQSLRIFRHKNKSNRSFERYKAQLVDDGVSQQNGIDYGDTFSHVVKLANIQTIFSVA